MKMLNKTFHREALIISNDSHMIPKSHMRKLENLFSCDVPNEPETSENCHEDTDCPIRNNSTHGALIIEMLNKYAHHMNPMPSLPPGKPLSCPPRIGKLGRNNIARKRLVSTESDSRDMDRSCERLSQRRKLDYSSSTSSLVSDD